MKCKTLYFLLSVPFLRVSVVISSEDPDAFTIIVNSLEAESVPFDAVIVKL